MISHATQHHPKQNAENEQRQDQRRTAEEPTIWGEKSINAEQRPTPHEKALKPARTRPRVGCHTVEPIRNLKDIRAIKGVLAGRLRDLALFVIGIHTGFRGQDLLGLRWRDVLTDAGRITERISLTEAKTRKTRTLPLQENARIALEQLWRAKQPTSLDTWVFEGRQGNGRLSTGRLHQLINRWAKEAGVHGHFGAHTLRKTFGYQLRQQGTDIGLLMMVFNHTNPAVTRRYLGINQTEIDAVTLKLNL